MTDFRKLAQQLNAEVTGVPDQLVTMVMVEIVRRAFEAGGLEVLKNLQASNETGR